MPDFCGMDFFQDLAWQPHTVETSFEPNRKYYGNGFGGFKGSVVVVSDHKLPTPPSCFTFFENGQHGQSPSSPPQEFEDALSDEDFGEFESVPAITALASKNAGNPNFLPPLPASQLMLRAHGAALTSALQSRPNHLDRFSFSYPDFDIPTSQHSQQETISDAAAKKESASDVFPVPFSSFPMETDMEDTDWGDFVQPSVVTTETPTTQSSDFFSLDPKELDRDNLGRNSHEDVFESQTISLSPIDTHGVLNDQDSRFSVGVVLKSEALFQKTPSHHNPVKEVSTDGSSCKEICPDIDMNGNYEEEKVDLIDPGGFHPKVKSANGTQQMENARNRNLFPGIKPLAPIPVSVFGDSDALIEDSVLESSKLLLHDENWRKEKHQLSSGSRSASSSCLPPDAFSNYIASLYTQSSVGHQRRHSSCTVMTSEVDSKKSFQSENSKVCSFEDMEAADQQETEGSGSKEINVLLKDVKSLEGVPSWISPSATYQEQLLYLKAWNTVASVCAYELAHGRALWQHARQSGISVTLISNSEGGSYFVSLGQIHAVCLILEAVLQVYRPWVEAASDEGYVFKAALRHCREDWSQLKDGVYSAIVGFESGSTLRSSWDSLEDLCSSGAAAQILSSEKGTDICRLSLLPLYQKTGVRAANWDGQQIFLPLANLWANCVSTQPPQLPHILCPT